MHVICRFPGGCPGTTYGSVILEPVAELLEEIRCGAGGTFELRMYAYGVSIAADCVSHGAMIDREGGRGRGDMSRKKAVCPVDDCRARRGTNPVAVPDVHRT